LVVAWHGNLAGDSRNVGRNEQLPPVECGTRPVSAEVEVSAEDPAIESAVTARTPHTEDVAPDLLRRHALE